MTQAPSPAPGAPPEVRDTIVPGDALPELPPEGALGDTLPPQDAAPAWRRNPDVRARPGLALGAGVAIALGAAALVPVVVVALLLWPSPPSGTAPSAPAAKPPSVDFAALRAAIPSAPAAAPAKAAPSAPRVEPDSSLHAFARLANRVYDAREVWRKSGQSGKELFRTATVEELGGAAFVDELQLSPRRFVWLRREAKVLAPASAQVPDGISMKDATNDPGPKVFDGTLEGRPVRAIRSCVFGETYCLVDVVDLGDVPAAQAAAPAKATPPDGADDVSRLAAFDAAVAKEQARLAAWTPTSVPEAPSATRAPPMLALLAGLALAAALAAGAAARLRRIAGAVIGSTARLRAATAGQPLGAGPAEPSAELAQLSAAVEEAAAALGEGAARAELASRRRARLGQIASALDLAAAGKAAPRLPADRDDDVALAALVASVNAALERFPARPPAQ